MHNYAWRHASGSLPQLSYTTEPMSMNTNSSVSSTNHAIITRVDKVSNSQINVLRLRKDPTLSELSVQYPTNSVFTQKPSSNNFYLVVKQKRYAPSSMSSNKHILNHDNFLINSKFAAKDSNFLSQHAAIRSEVPSVQSNRRLLRTRRVLVLPAHTNITLITNSFDVMHS